MPHVEQELLTLWFLLLLLLQNKICTIHIQGICIYIGHYILFNTVRLIILICRLAMSGE